MKKCSSYLLSVMFSMGIVGSSLKANLPDFGGEFPLEPDAQGLFFQDPDDLSTSPYLFDDAMNSFFELPNYIDGFDSTYPANQLSVVDSSNHSTIIPQQTDTNSPTLNAGTAPTAINQIAASVPPVVTIPDTGTVLKQRKKRKRTGYNPLSQSLLQRLSVVDRKGMSKPLFWDAVKKINLTCVVDDKNRGRTGLFNVFELFNNAMQKYNKTPNNKSYYRDYMRYRSYLRKVPESCDSSTLSEFNNNEQKNMLDVLDLIGQHYGEPEAAVIKNIRARLQGDSAARATIPSILANSKRRRFRKVPKQSPQTKTQNSKGRKPRHSSKKSLQTDTQTTQTIASPVSPHAVSQVVSSDIAPNATSTLGNNNPQIETDQSTIIPQQTETNTPTLNAGTVPIAMNPMTTPVQPVVIIPNTDTVKKTSNKLAYNPLNRSLLKKISNINRKGMPKGRFEDGVEALNLIGIVPHRNGFLKGFLASFVYFINAAQKYRDIPNSNHQQDLSLSHKYLRDSLNAIQPLRKIDNNVKPVAGLFEQHYADHCYKEILQNALGRLQGDPAALATIPLIPENSNRRSSRHSQKQNPQMDAPTTQTMANPVSPHAVSQVVSSDIAPNATSTFDDENLQIVTDPNATISDPIDFGGEFPSRTGIQDMYFQNPDDWTDLSDLLDDSIDSFLDIPLQLSESNDPIDPITQDDSNAKVRQ